jgi:hypothetical protein
LVSIPFHAVSFPTLFKKQLRGVICLQRLRLLYAYWKRIRSGTGEGLGGCGIFEDKDIVVVGSGQGVMRMGLTMA